MKRTFPFFCSSCSLALLSSQVVNGCEIYNSVFPPGGPTGKVVSDDQQHIADSHWDVSQSAPEERTLLPVGRSAAVGETTIKIRADLPSRRQTLVQHQQIFEVESCVRSSYCCWLCSAQEHLRRAKRSNISRKYSLPSRDYRMKQRQGRQPLSCGQWQRQTLR
jgi:hypothetical protein